jgi:hypothetical protein
MTKIPVFASVKGLSYIAAFALGVPLGIFLTKENPEHSGHSLSCFEETGTQELQVFGEAGAEKITLATLPADLRQRLTQIQMNSYRESLSVIEEFAVRRSLSEQNVPSQHLPVLDQLQKQDISDEELQNFYKNNRPAFGSRMFDEVKPLLRKQISGRRTEVFLKSKRDELHAKGYFKPYFSAPCGSVLRGEISNSIHYAGNNTAQKVIELFTDYSVEARILDAKITAAIRGRENELKVLIVPIAREGDVESEFLVRGFFCAQKLSTESAIKFHKAALTAARNAVNNVSPSAAGKALALGIAERARLDSNRISPCLDSQDVATEILAQRKVREEKGISGNARVFLNKREVLLSNQLEIDDVIAQFAEKNKHAKK